MSRNYDAQFVFRGRAEWSEWVKTVYELWRAGLAADGAENCSMQDFFNAGVIRIARDMGWTGKPPERTTR